jgi:hypothetical protein
MSETTLRAPAAPPADFRFGEVPSFPRRDGHALAFALVSTEPSLGPLAAFKGTFAGSGFNVIFRPDSAQSPTPLPTPVAASDNVLELNLTSETLIFGAGLNASSSLGSVPNRGTGPQADAFLNGVPYLQKINDVTDPGRSVGIHFEPGLWMIVPATTNPAEGPTLARMASIPHGTTIDAQGTFQTVVGPPDFTDPKNKRDITPFVIGNPAQKIKFPSQTLANAGTPRIPQDLTALNASGRLIQGMLDDPNSLLSGHISGQTITATTVILISTSPAAPLFGGGTDNIAFLLGDAAAQAPNANAISMDAIFWIETVQYQIVVPVHQPGDGPIIIQAPAGTAGAPVPSFVVDPPAAITTPKTITVTSTQIQYSQLVLLNFATLSWPHVSVATLVPVDPVQVPASVFDS